MSAIAGTQEKLTYEELKEVGFHKTYLVHPRTKTAVCLHGELYF